MRFITKVAIGFCLSAGMVLAEPVDNLADGRSGDIEFTSVAPKGHFALSQGTFDRAPIPVRGKLLLPAGNGKVPAVVIGHTSGGVEPSLFSRWAKSFNDAGYAAFVIDSLGPRGLGSVTGVGISTDFNAAFLIADAFKALALLASHPRIDAARIAFVGFSMGAGTAHYVIHERFRHAVLGDVPWRFAAAVAHYPPCHYDFYENQPSPVPLFLFLGEQDDWTPAARCQQYGSFLAARGYKVTTHVYEGAQHGYDQDASSQHIENATNLGGCDPLVVNLDEPVLAPRYLRNNAPLVPDADTRAAAIGVYKWIKACTSNGATLGISNGKADRREEAVKDTLKALKSVFASGT